MESIVGIIDGVADWVRENIASRLKLKKPKTNQGRGHAADRGAGLDDAAYNAVYETVQPAVYAMYVPLESPPDYESPYPYICLRAEEGQEAAAERSGRLDMRVFVGVWNPGQHNADMRYPAGGNAFEQREDPAFFNRDSEGWRDVWNAIDVILRALKSAEDIGGAALKQDVPIRYGPLKEQDAVVDMWPYWVGWVTFSLDYGLYRRKTKQDEFLYG